MNPLPCGCHKDETDKWVCCNDHMQMVAVLLDKHVCKVCSGDELRCECCGEEMARYRISQAHDKKKVCYTCFKNDNCGPEYCSKGDDE